MKKYMDKLRKNIRINKNLFLFLLIIVIVGVVSGSIFTMILSSEDKTLVLEYLNNFFGNTEKGNLDYSSSLINIFIFTVGFALLMWLLGISVIGFFIVIFMLFLKAFILGFSVSSIIMGFKIKGVLYALIYVFPHQIINLFIFMLLSAYALIISFKLIRALKGKISFTLKNIINKYLIVLEISVVVLIMTSLYEIYIMPKIFEFIIN